MQLAADQGDESILLQGEDLSLRFGGLQVLTGVSFVVRKGELLAVIGPNGSGKTSLLNCISGFYRPQQGSIHFEGQNITGMKPHRIARMGIGRTFQHLGLYPEMTVLDNLMLAQYMHAKASFAESMLPFGRAHREEIQHRALVEEIIGILQLEDLRNMIVGALPYGQRKLVELGRALATQPKLVLLDEPTSGLDAVMKRTIATLIADIQTSMGIAAILIEHDMRVVMDLAGQIVVLDYGRKIAEGTPYDIGRDPRVIEAYLGDETLRREAT